MVGDTVGPDTPQNVRQEKPRLPPQITAGMCRFFKDLKSHENPGVKIRIEYKEKDALKAICADIGVDYFYPKKNSTYEWLVYPLISLRHAVRVVDVLKGELSSLMDVNLGNAHQRRRDHGVLRVDLRLPRRLRGRQLRQLTAPPHSCPRWI